ncbi:MAG TPA: hypothetical protein VK204_13090 [Nocardioidaceae bacterium]|nr:hypothetical protein [Nocardioidaceae bacterium]
MHQLMHPVGVRTHVRLEQQPLSADHLEKVGLVFCHTSHRALRAR